MGSIPAILDISLKKHSYKLLPKYVKFNKQKHKLKINFKNKFFFKNNINFRKYDFFRSSYASLSRNHSFIDLGGVRFRFNKYLIYPTQALFKDTDIKHVPTNYSRGMFWSKVTFFKNNFMTKYVTGGAKY